MSPLSRLEQGLAGYAYRFNSEVELHERIAQVLTELGFSYRHEHRIALGRFDFLVETDAGLVVLEVKVAGSLGEALRQAARYCEHPDVTAVLLVATPLWSRKPLPPTQFHGKEVRLVPLGRSAF